MGPREMDVGFADGLEPGAFPDCLGSRVQLIRKTQEADGSQLAQ